MAQHYETLAQSMPAKWEQMAREGDHTKLAFDQPNTWSQVYNLVWDNLLDLHLFSASVAKDETTFYLTRMKPYGLPLDSRKTITKLDWEFWTASLGATRNCCIRLLLRRGRGPMRRLRACRLRIITTP